MKTHHRISLFASPLLLFAPFALTAQIAAPAPTIAVTVLAQSPADTKTDLQIICLFRSAPENKLHGSLIEIDEKLHGLVTRIRTPALFSGELGETLLLTPPASSLNAGKLLIIGLGDSATFTPDRMYFAGKIALREANRLEIAHPFFAPTVLDGGVAGFPTGVVANQFVHGFRDALATEVALRDAGSATTPVVTQLTFLAGAAHVADTQKGINEALTK